MATIKEILEMSMGQRKQAYKATGIDKVIIDNNEFTDYKAFSFIWEKSYVKSPERSADGSIGNLNSYATFVTPHLKIDFSMMSIDSYRVLMMLLYEKNEHLVQCYDIVNNQFSTHYMYFATEEMPKLWTIAMALNGEEWVELLGVQDYTVELIGTNNKVLEYKLTYKLNVPSGATWSGKTETEVVFAKNTTVNIGAGAVFTVNGTATNVKNITFGDKYIFNGWKSLDGIKYIDGDEYYLMGNKTLSAQWKASV